MNRSTSRLKPLAPKPDSAPRPSHFFPLATALTTNHDGKNVNAFAGSHLGVPAGPLENVTSMDPKDYVWGVPQSQPGLFMAPQFASQPLYAPAYQPHTSFGMGMTAAYSAPQASGAFSGIGHNLTGVGGMQHMQHVQTGDATMNTSLLGARIAGASAPLSISQPMSISQQEAEQASAALDQVDDLLNIQFDDDCIKKLLGEPNSGPGALEGEMFGSPGVLCTTAAAECMSPRAKGTSPGPSHNSTATGEEGGDALQMDLGYGAASSGQDILDATDLHFPMEETSVLETMSGFGDLDLQILEAGALSEVETTSAPMLTHQPTTAVQNTVQLPPSPRALKRAKSDIGTTGNQVLQAAGSGEYNPLLSLALNDALASINGFLASNLASVPEEKRQAALQAIVALQSASVSSNDDSSNNMLLPSADAVAALTRANSLPSGSARRKRASPRLNTT